MDIEEHTGNLVTIRNVKASIEVLLNKHGGTAEILNINTQPEFQRQGEASRLVEKIPHLFQTSFRLYAITRMSNGGAVQFYESLGFKTMTVMQDFYTVGYPHAIMMGAIIEK